MKGGINTQNQVLAPAQAHPPPGTFVETFSQGTRTTDPKARQPQGDTLKKTEGHGRPALTGTARAPFILQVAPTEGGHTHAPSPPLGRALCYLPGEQGT